MIDKHKAIEEMATTMHGFACGGNCHNKKCQYGCGDFHNAEWLVKHNYGNIPQALTEFAERLKEIGRNRPNWEGKFNGRAFVIGDPPYVTNNEIDQTLKELIPNADIPE